MSSLPPSTPTEEEPERDRKHEHRGRRRGGLQRPCLAPRPRDGLGVGGAREGHERVERDEPSGEEPVELLLEPPRQAKRAGGGVIPHLYEVCEREGGERVGVRLTQRLVLGEGPFPVGGMPRERLAQDGAVLEGGVGPL